MTEYQNPRYAIFHHPRPVSSEGTSASQIRPYLMYKALQEIGSQIDLVAGYTKELNEAVRKNKRKITDGYKYEFLYSESSTCPTLLTEDHRFPTFPNLDFRKLFLQCHIRHLSYELKQLFNDADLWHNLTVCTTDKTDSRDNPLGASVGRD